MDVLFFLSLLFLLVSLLFRVLDRFGWEMFYLGDFLCVSRASLFLLCCLGSWVGRLFIIFFVFVQAYLFHWFGGCGGCGGGFWVGCLSLLHGHHVVVAVLEGFYLGFVPFILGCSAPSGVQM